MMANTCSELSGTDEGELASYNYNLSRSFTSLMLDTLSNLPMMTPACLETAEALMIAVRFIGLSEADMLTQPFRHQQLLLLASLRLPGP